jgi:hypothetical protein
LLRNGSLPLPQGGEGLGGAGIQTGSFRSGVARELPPDTALLAVHAINPYGFAWMRRVTEGNVDLNRNVVGAAAASNRETARAG